MDFYSVQVSYGSAQTQSVSIPILLIPLTSLKNPFSPHADPQEFLIIQYLTPSSTPYPTTEIP